MAALRRAFFAGLLGVTAPLLANAASKPMERWQLKVGEERELTLPRTDELTISRRGVVALHWLPDNKASLVGLKPGFVLITLQGASLSPEQELPTLLAIEVLAPPPKHKSPPLEKSTYLPRWLCAPKGIHCDDDAGLYVEGTTDEAAYFLRAKGYCSHHKRCTFAALLSSSGQQNLAAYWRGLLGHLGEMQSNGLGQTLVSLPCLDGSDKDLTQHHKLIDGLSGGMVGRHHLILACRKNLALTRYLLKAKIILMNTQTAEQWGFNGSLQVQATTPPLQSLARLSSRLHTLLGSRQAQVLGEPLLHALGGQAVYAKSGGEFLTIHPAALVHDSTTAPKPPIEAWKDYGLALAATISPAQTGEVLFDYELDLKQPSPNHSQLQASKLRSQMLAPLGQDFIAGSITLRSQANSSEDFPLLTKLPLLGPLFKAFGKESTTAQVYLWVRIEEETASS